MVAVGPALAGATNRMPHTVLLASLEAGGGHAALRDSFHAALSEADPGTEEPHIPYIERNQVGVYEPRPRQMVELIAEVSALQPASGRMGSLLEVFPARAAAIREENRARAARLADFLDTVVAEPLSRPVGRVRSASPSRPASGPSPGPLRTIPRGPHR
jgi:hypothetical protein